MTHLRFSPVRHEERASLSQLLTLTAVEKPYLENEGAFLGSRDVFTHQKTQRKRP